MIGENGHVFLHHMAGALVGEGGALGIANKRSTQISAWKARYGASRVTTSCHRCTEPRLEWFG